jgi:hypothetical protein
LLVRAYVRLRHLMLYTDLAIAQGYPRLLVWQVAADSQRDTPWLLQGKANYTGITKAEITNIARRRVTSAALALFAVLWIPLTFPMIAVLGFLGVFNDVLTWLMLLGPFVVMLAASISLRYKQWRATQPFRVRETLDRETAAQAAGWSQLYAALGLQRTRSKATAELKLAMGGAWLAAFILLIPLGLTLITTVIPRFVASGAGVYTSMGFAPLRSLQHYRTAVDSAISDVDAGRALHNVRFAGLDPGIGGALMQRPTRPHPAVFTDTQFTRSTNPEFWADSLFRWVKRGSLTPDQRRRLMEAATHPANEDFSLLAQATRIDIPGTRWDLVRADTVVLTSLPFGLSKPLREVAQAHLAQAALQFGLGAIAGAEATLGEIISAGFLLREEAPTMIDALQGGVLVRVGARALASLFEETGRAGDAAEIRAGISASDAMAMSRTRGTGSVEAAYTFVLTRRNPRAARWETFAALQTAAPCMSLYAGIFGPTAEHEAWVERARQTLVRTPSEERYFRLVKKGYAAKTNREAGRCTPRVLRQFREILMGY